MEAARAIGPSDSAGVLPCVSGDIAGGPPMSDVVNAPGQPPVSGDQFPSTCDLPPRAPSLPSTDLLVAPQIPGYQIVGRLGEGGMGVVWRAVQMSAKREVALKLMSAAGLGSERARARFTREVELTAKLEHPNIARLYDSGIEQGVCYYAMELVQGRPLDEYVLSRGLERPEILRLMRSICRAVQYAHQRGVIHRDLKPANILVDKEGQPHVLDFGLAKAMLAESGPAVSVDGEVAGTPAFMSPEQAAGRPDRVDTRSDVYSLGVILFLLLAGENPHDLSGSYLEVLRRIAEGQVKRPRGVAPQLDRELELLLLKSLATDPEGRYASAGDLAKDVDNYLNHEPLTAKPPTLSYFVRKRVRKYRVPLAIAGGVGLCLSGMAVLSVVRIHREKVAALNAETRAEKARDEAVRQKKNAAAALDFLRTALGAPAAKGYDVKVLDVLGDAAKSVQGESVPEVRDAVRFAIGRTYIDLHRPAEAEQVYREALNDRVKRGGSLEDLDAASIFEGLAYSMGMADGYSGRAEVVAYWQRCLDLRKRLLPPNDDLLMKTATELATHRMITESRHKGERLFLESVRPLVGPSKSLDQVRSELLAHIAQIRYLHQQGDEAGMVAYARAVLRPFLEHPISREQVPDAMGQVALWLLDRHDRAGAEAMARTAVALSRELNGAEHPLYAKVLAYVGHFLVRLRGLQEGVGMIREATRIAAKKLGPLDSATIAYTAELARALDHFGKAGEADDLRRDLLARADAAGAAAGKARCMILHRFASAVLADASATAPRRRAAEADLAEAYALAGQAYGRRHPQYFQCALDYEEALRESGRYADAQRLSRALLQTVRTEFGEEDPHTAVALDRLGRAVKAMGKTSEAVDLFARSCAIERAGAAMEASELSDSLRDLAAAQEDAGKLTDAEQTLRELIKEDTDRFGDDSDRAADSLHRLARVVCARGKRAEGLPLYEQALSAAIMAFGEQDQQTARVRRELELVRGGPASRAAATQEAP